MEKSTWEKVMACKQADTRHKGIANNLSDDELNTIIGVIDFFGDDYRLDIFDLKTASYVYSFLKAKGDIDDFIEDLRITDYDIDESWKVIELEGNV